MKVLVLQVKIGEASYSMPGYEDAHNDFKKYLIPSVQKYCEKYGYDYLEVTECPKELDVSWFTTSRFIPKRNIGSTLIRYYMMHQEGYDAVVSLDNDIYITPNAEPLPEIIGHMGVHDINIEKRRKTYITLDNFIRRIDTSKVGVINAGVQMVDSETGQMIKKYIKQVCDNQIHPIANYYSDQNYINYFRSKFPERSKLINTKWNFLVNRHDYSDYHGINFVHYCGPSGRKLFYRDLNNGLIES